MLSAHAAGRPLSGDTTEILFVTKGSSIYFQGDVATHWYEVLRGAVRTCRFYPDGRRQLTNFFHPGEVFGLDSGRYEEAAEAVTETRLRRHALSDDETGDSKGSAEGALRRALDSARRCIFLLGHKTAAERIAAFLIASTDKSDPSRVVLPMSRSDIADHLGLTIHTVSRTISELVRRGVIELGPRHSIRIVDYHGLRAITGDEEEQRPVGQMGWRVARGASNLR